jgi:hypothetical protein
LIVGKQRNGPTGDVQVVFLKHYGRFESAAQEGFRYDGQVQATSDP